MTTDELTSVIKNWPWFGAARRELCERMSKMGGSEWGKEQYADAAMYIASRTIVSDIVRSSRKEDYSDKDVQTLLKRFIAPEPKPVSEALSGVQSGDGEVHPSSAAAEYRLTPAAMPESANAKIGNNKNNMRRTDLI